MKQDAEEKNIQEKWQLKGNFKAFFRVKHKSLLLLYFTTSLNRQLYCLLPGLQ